MLHNMTNALVRWCACLEPTRGTHPPRMQAPLLLSSPVALRDMLKLLAVPRVMLQKRQPQGSSTHACLPALQVRRSGPHPPAPPPPPQAPCAPQL